MKDLDDNAIDELRRVLGAEFGVLVDTFIADGERRLAALRAGLAAGDLGAVRETAHSFKGSSLNVGAQRLADICLAIEQGARAGDAAPLAGRVAAADAAFRTVAGLLRTA